MLKQVAAEVTAASQDLIVEGLSKQFGEGPPVFADVSFTIDCGAAVALVGANGTGKSTLLRCCLGLIEPDAGRVKCLGTDIGGASRAALRKVRARTGLVAQKHNLSPRLSVLSNVIHGLLGQHSGPRYWLQALAPEDVREAAMDALKAVGLAEFALRRADRLSGGQSQRVAIARAIVGKPRFLIADEPTASLDPAAGEEVMSLFFSLMRDTGVTVLFTSHNIEHAIKYSDRIVGLANGGLRLDTSSDDVGVSDLRGLYD